MSAAKRLFVVDGGPGTGKTSIIKELKRRGCRVFAEGARMVLARDKRFKGKDAVAVAGAAFQDAIWEYELKRYDRLMRSNAEGDFFFDRGLYDGLAYAELGRFSLSPENVAQVRRVRYHQIFIVAPLPKELYVTDDARQESYEAALRLHQLIVKANRRFNRNLVCVPFATVERRADFVLAHLD
jgi:predicted ATPase